MERKKTKYAEVDGVRNIRMNALSLSAPHRPVVLPGVDIDIDVLSAHAHAHAP